MNVSKVIYILEKTELAGGVKVVLEHCNRLTQIGIPASIYSLQPFPTWFDCNFDLLCFSSYEDLGRELKSKRVPKVATLWRTAPTTASSSVNDEGYYLVQDIETSYYKERNIQDLVLETYNLPLQRLSVSRWVEGKLAEMQRPSQYIGIGIEHSLFRLIPQTRRRENVILINAPRYPRHWEIKGMSLLSAALEAISKADASLKIVSFSTEKMPLSISGIEIEHWTDCSDKDIASLYQSAGCFLLTSAHEGFCLPALEAMACGCPVIITRANGNEEFCINNQTCLLVERDPNLIAASVLEVLSDKNLAEKLSIGGLEIAIRYQWSEVVTNLVKALNI